MRYRLLTALVLGLFSGCGAQSTAQVVAPNTPVAPNTTSPQSTAIRAPASDAPFAVVEPVIVAPPAPKYECTVFVMGDPKTAFKATVQDKQFKQQEMTSTEINMYAKVLQGDEMKRIVLCEAFAKRKCPEAWRGDDTHCRMQTTVDAEAEWGNASPVPK